jgi:protein-S-isoprenylcysteine O-methyltransferase Ste14
VGKVVLTWWSIRTLGPWYSYHLIEKEGHELVRKGPYRVCRHPLYAARLFATAGIPLSFGAFLSLPLFLFLDCIAIAWRIRSEDRVLSKAFGDVFESYRRDVSALFPWKWVLGLLYANAMGQDFKSGPDGSS